MSTRIALKKVARGFYLALQIGLLVTVAVLLGRQSARTSRSPLAPAAVPQPTSEPGSETLKPPPPAQPTRLMDLASADRLFAETRWDEAREAYDQLAEVSARGVRLTALYRAALCSEAMGDYPEAESRYAALRSEVSDPVAASTLLICQARCWLRMGMAPQAIAAAVELLIQQSGDLGDHPAVHEARYLLALASARRTAGTVASAVTDPTLQPTDVRLDWVPTYALSWLQPILLSGGKPAIEPPTDELVRVERLGAGATDLRIDMFQRQIGARELLEQIARRGGITIELSAAAAEQLREHRYRVHVRGILLSQLLSYLALRLDMVWTVEADGRVSLRTVRELPTASVAVWRTSLAERLTREANVWRPQHPALSAAYVQLGLLRLQRRELSEAQAAFTRAIEEDTDKQAVTAAAYNSAIAALLQRDYLHATEQLYYVVDAAPGSALASRAHQLLGRVHLVEGRWANAVSECRRALLTASDRRARALAALWLAMAYLFDDNPVAAGQVLHREQQLLAQPPWNPLRRFLKAYAEYVQTNTPDRYQRTELLSSAVELPDARWLGTPGVFLIGDAARLLGLDDLMRDVYEKHLDALWPGHLTDTIHQRLVDYYRDRGQYRRALEHLFAQSSHADESRLIEAKVQQALLYLEDGNLAKAIATARATLREANNENTIRRLLHIMGEAYRRAGDHERAALCFLGRLPLE